MWEIWCLLNETKTYFCGLARNDISYSVIVWINNFSNLYSNFSATWLKMYGILDVHEMRVDSVYL